MTAKMAGFQNKTLIYIFGYNRTKSYKETIKQEAENIDHTQSDVWQNYIRKHTRGVGVLYEFLGKHYLKLRKRSSLLF